MLHGSPLHPEHVPVLGEHHVPGVVEHEDVLGGEREPSYPVLEPVLASGAP